MAVCVCVCSWRLEVASGEQQERHLIEARVEFMATWARLDARMSLAETGASTGN